MHMPHTCREIVNEVEAIVSDYVTMDNARRIVTPEYNNGSRTIVTVLQCYELKNNAAMVLRYM